MTAAALTPSIEYLENGVTLAFAVPFRFRAPTHIRAQRISAAGVVTELAYGGDYIVSGGETDSGGTLTVVTAAVAGTRLRIRRETPRAQDMDYTTGDTFPAESHEGALDKAMLIDQEQDRQITDTARRALLVPDGEVAPVVSPKAVRAGKFPLWSADGSQLVESSGTGADAGLRADLASSLLGTLLLVWKAAGAGAVARTLYARLLDLPLSVRDYGLKGDATTENPAHLVAAVAAAAGRELQVPKGSYVFTAAVDLSGLTDVTLHAEAGAVFDFTGLAAADEALVMGGTLGASFALALDAAKGATSITVAGGHGLAIGAHCRIISTALWNPINAQYIKGEHIIVKGVAGNVITLAAPLEDSYTAAITTLNRYNSGRLRVTGDLLVRRSGITKGVMVRYTNGAELIGLRVEGAQERCLSFTENHALYAERCRGAASYAAGPGTNYGLCCLSNAASRFVDCSGYGGRHGLTTGGTFPDRDIIFVRFDADCDGAENQSAMDTHSNGDRFRFVDCTSRNGAHFFSKNVTITGGNFVSRTLAKGAIIWEFDAVNSGQFICEPDYVENKAGLVGIWTRGGIDGAGADFIRLAPRKIRTGNPGIVDAAGLIALQARTAGWTCIVPRSEIICGDAIIEAVPPAAVSGVAVGASTVWQGDVVLSGRFGEALAKVRAAYLKVTGKITSRDSRFVGSDPGNNLIDHEGGDWISDNDRFDGGPVAVARCVSSTSTGFIHLFNPTFVNLITNGGFESANSTNVLIANARQTGCTGQFAATGTHIRKSVGPRDVCELMVTAAPTQTHFGDGSVAQLVPPVSAAAWEWVKIAGAWLLARNAP